MQQELKPTPSLTRQSSLSRVVLVLYLATLALLPWTWFPPFPWLQEHAQWSDAVFAVTAGFWAIDKFLARQWPQFHPAHIAIGLYFTASTFSFLLASPDKVIGGLKLLGIGELCMLAVITGDLASQPSVLRAIARTVAWSALAIAAAAACGLILFYAGIRTPLIGIYGELTPSTWYARIQAGFYNPNLLVSFAIFAAAIVNHRDAKLPTALRRSASAALAILAVLTFSRGILGFALSVIIRNARTRARKIVAAAFAITGIGIMIFLSLFRVSLDPTNPFSLSLDPTIQPSRYQAATTALETLVSNPLWGSGPGTSPGRYLGHPFDSHCTPINIAATLGLPALAAFVLLLIVLWRRRELPTELALWGGFAGLALDSMGQDIEDFRHLWVMIGIAIANRRKA